MNLEAIGPAVSLIPRQIQRPANLRLKHRFVLGICDWPSCILNALRSCAAAYITSCRKPPRNLKERQGLVQAIVFLWAQVLMLVGRCLQASLEFEQKVARRQAQRRQQRQAEELIQQQQAAEVDGLTSQVDKTLDSWASGKGIVAMLRSIGEIFQPAEHAISPRITADATQHEVKKAYRQIVRVVHPDKLKAAMPTKEKLLAQKLFTRINHAYEEYRD